MKIVNVMTNLCQKLCLHNLPSLASCLVSAASRSRQYLYWEVNTKFSSWVLFIHPRIGLEIKLNRTFRLGLTDVLGTIVGGGPLWVGPKCSSPFDKIVVCTPVPLFWILLTWLGATGLYRNWNVNFCWMEWGPCCKLQSLLPLFP